MDQQEPGNIQPETQEIPEYATPYSVDVQQYETASDLKAYHQKISALPGPVSTVLKAFATAKFVEEQITKEYVTNKEQRRGITRIIRDVLLGELFMGDIAKVLETQYGVPFESAQGISRLILYRLFTPIIEEVRKMQRERFAGRLTPDTPGGLPTAPPEAPASPPPPVRQQPTPVPVSATPIQPPAPTAQPPIQEPPRQNTAPQNSGEQAPKPPQEFKNLANVIDLRNM